MESPVAAGSARFAPSSAGKPRPNPLGYVHARTIPRRRLSTRHGTVDATGLRSRQPPKADAERMKNSFGAHHRMHKSSLVTKAVTMPHQRLWVDEATTSRSSNCLVKPLFLPNAEYHLSASMALTGHCILQRHVLICIVNTVFRFAGRYRYL